MKTDIQLIEQLAVRAGMTSMLNHGAASLVFTEGVEGVSQEQLVRYTEHVALHCASALGALAAAPAADAAPETITNFDPLTIARHVCRLVAELGDRNSPEGQPDMMLVTADELLAIVIEAFADQAESMDTEGGRESVEDALAVVESFGPGTAGVNDTFARQILLAAEIKRLRKLCESAVQGRADMRAGLREARAAQPQQATLPASEADLATMIGESLHKQVMESTDQSVTAPFKEWLDSVHVRGRQGVGANEAWNAGAAYASAQPQADAAEPVAGLNVDRVASDFRPWPDHSLTLLAGAKSLPVGWHKLYTHAQPAAAMESVLIEGVAYAVPAPVAGELLRLHIDAALAAAQPAPQALGADAYTKRSAKELGDAVAAWIGDEYMADPLGNRQPKRWIKTSVERLGYAVEAVLAAATTGGQS